VVRKRAVGGGFHEQLTILNHGSETVELDVRIDAACDFADLFEVKDALAKKGQLYHRAVGGKLVLGYQRQRFVRETWIQSSEPAEIDGRGLRFSLSIAPHGAFHTDLKVIVAWDGVQRRSSTKYGHDAQEPRPDTGSSLESWVEHAPRLVSSWAELDHTYRRSLIDLAALRFYSQLSPRDALPAAGLPWFMAVFGRDSIFTSLQSLPFHPSLACTTLKVLGWLQGSCVDDFRDEEPGKIIHEVRWGELTAFEERPQSPYFGAADSSALYLILLDEYERWSGDIALVRALERNARAALAWIDQYGDRDGDGYVEYQARDAKTGLANQCWKDSWDSIRFADGRMAKLPRATCELQGYVYDAKRRAARLARAVWRDADLADRLEREAAILKDRFNRDFWVEKRQFFALALDGDKQQVDSLTSNIGHLLWSGIVEPDKADACVRHLMGDKLFSGWGVRTMAEGEGAYNPIGYHVGTVWPHDNSIIAWGLRRYGYREEAARLALAMLQAATYFHGRLPEVFAGYSRAATQFPVEFPTACSPQAWAAGTPLLLLRTLLGLEPLTEGLFVDPAVPDEITRLELLNIPGRWGQADAFGRGRVHLDEAGHSLAF
jgi:glycogen debranching enzyme